MRSLSCKNCGASLETTGNYLVCSYCNTRYFMEEGENEVSKISLTDLEKYNIAFNIYTYAKSSKEYMEAANLFKEITGLRDSDLLLSECLKKASSAHKDEIYLTAIEMTKNNNIHFLQRAAKLFDTIPDWKDSDVRRAFCLEEISRQTALIEEKNKKLRKRNELKRIRKNALIIVSGILILLIYTLLFIFDNN